MAEHEHKTVGTEWFSGMDNMLNGGVTEGQVECAAILEGWIDYGFPERVSVAAQASGDTVTGFFMSAFDLLTAATTLDILSAFEMPKERRDACKEYITDCGMNPGSEFPENEPVRWFSAIYELRLAAAAHAEARATREEAEGRQARGSGMH